MQLEKMLTVNDVANLLKVHPNTVRRWERGGQLQSYRFGVKGIIRFMREDIFKSKQGRRLRPKVRKRG